MPYSSPLHILPPEELANEEATGDAFLMRLRKKLLAEYNLANEPEITINGRSYTKDTIIKTIDMLMGTPDLPLHLYIFRQPVLLAFLEGKNARFNYNDFLLGNPPEALLPRIQALLIEQALALYKKSVQARDFTDAQFALLLLKQMPGYQTEDYFQVIFSSLENIRDQVNSERAGDLVASARNLVFLKMHAFSLVINQLSEDFIDTINSLLGDIINYMVAYQKTAGSDKAFLYSVSTTLTKINCDPELKDLIERNHKVFSNNYLGAADAGGSGKRGTGELSAGRIIYIVAVILVFGARIFFTCDRSSNHNYDFKSYAAPLKITEPTVDEKLKEIRDHSIYKEERLAMAGLYDSTRGLSFEGKNPFSFLANADDESLADTSLVPVKIVNHSSYDLVMIRHRDDFVHSNYISMDSTFTFKYPLGYSLCFYAGTNWLKIKDLNLEQSGGFGRYSYLYENKFADSPPNSKTLFSTDYVIDFLGKKPKRKKPYILELTNEFIETGAYKNKTLQLAPLTYTASESADVSSF